MKFQTSAQYSALQRDFFIDLPDTGYMALTGPNNSAKTTILQFLFREIYSTSEYGSGKVALILTERMHVSPTTQTGSNTLEQYNDQLINRLRQQIVQQDSSANTANQLPGVLLNHNDFLPQVTKVNEYLKRLQLEQFRLSGAQTIQFRDVAVHFQGSGLRSLFYILAALSDETLKFILIDEPELSLEPRLERVLRELLIDESKGRSIIVATHSNLFLNRESYALNYRVFSEDHKVKADPLTSQNELLDITFNLLGNSLMDLFFPGNYLVVEGSSDQIIAEKVQEVLGIDRSRIKVLAAAGIDNIQRTYKAVTESLLPLIVNDSPYSSRAVALIDNVSNDQHSLDELNRLLGDRLIKLPDNSLEEYINESLYVAAGRSKSVDLEEISRTTNHTDLGALKKEISTAISKIITVDNVDLLLKFKEAITKADELVS